MTVVNVVLLACMCAGIALVIISLIRLKGEGGKGEGDSQADDAIRTIGDSISEADNAIDEMNKMGKAILEEIDGRYQELLFLYNMIDEKSAGIKTRRADVTVNEKTKAAYSNPKLVKIKKLLDEGQSVTDIAKGLNMGQGEVQLILNLGKDR